MSDAKAIYLIHQDFGTNGTAYLEADPASPASTVPADVAHAIYAGTGSERLISVHLIDFAAGVVTDVTKEFREMVAELEAKEF